MENTFQREKQWLKFLWNPDGTNQRKIKTGSKELKQDKKGLNQELQTLKKEFKQSPKAIGDFTEKNKSKT